MAKPRKPVHIPPLSAKECQELIRHVEQVTIEYTGLFDNLETALGMLMIGRLVGWKVLVLIHNKRTIRKYEEILGGISIREVFPEEGPLAHKSAGLALAKKIGNFWKAVSGEIKIEDRRELTQG
jgi:hypothetical protein